MQLSLHSDYSCRVLIYLALKESGLASIEEIATAYGISRNHLVKIVHRLGQAGFVETVRGRQGGLRVGRDPAEINLGDVIRTMEPNMNIVECFSETKNA